jgi:hypothetical protein
MCTLGATCYPFDPQHITIIFGKMQRFLLLKKVGGRGKRSKLSMLRKILLWKRKKITEDKYLFVYLLQLLFERLVEVFLFHIEVNQGKGKVVPGLN